MKKEIIVISDIHGRGSELKQIICKLKNRLDQFKFILLGDYIGYGKENLEVIKMLKYLKENTDCVILKGNWEDMFYSYVREKYSTDPFTIQKREMFQSRGGVKAMNELFTNKTLLNFYIDLIEDMPLYHLEEINDKVYIFAHSGLDFSLIEEDDDIETIEELLIAQDEVNFIWNFSFFDLVQEYSTLVDVLPFKMVAGHTPVQVLNENNEICLYNYKNIVYGVDFGASRSKGKLGIVNFSRDNPIVYLQNYL